MRKSLIYYSLLINQIKDVLAIPDENSFSLEDPCQKCDSIYRGVLHRATDPEDLAQGCLVYAVLHCDDFNLFRGKDQVATMKVPQIQTPLLFTPTSDLCFTVREGSGSSEILCAENAVCRDEWWKAITQAILCSHRGPTMRNEISGESYAEEMVDMVETGDVKDPEKQGGISIKLTGIAEKPKVTVL